MSTCAYSRSSERGEGPARIRTTSSDAARSSSSGAPNASTAFEAGDAATASQIERLLLGVIMALEDARAAPQPRASGMSAGGGLAAASPPGALLQSLAYSASAGDRGVGRWGAVSCGILLCMFLKETHGRNINVVNLEQ